MVIINATKTPPAIKVKMLVLHPKLAARNVGKSREIRLLPTLFMY